jgi:hypothetical protein
METLYTILAALVGAGIIMIGYRALRDFLRNLDEDDSGIDDLAAKAMDLGEDLAEDGEKALKDVLDEKAKGDES